MFRRLYHPLILRGACVHSCKCTCRCLTSGQRLSFLELLIRNRTNQCNITTASPTTLSPHAMPSGNRPNCLFCRIVDGTDEQSKDKIIFQDDEFVVFPDIRPAAKYHLLVVTKEHINDAKCLAPSQSELLQRMVDTGKKVLSDQIKSESTPDANAEIVNNARLGFHWPPFHTISHLHLHVIAPPNEIGFIGRVIFRPNSFWFVQPSWVQERLERQAKTEHHSS